MSVKAELVGDVREALERSAVFRLLALGYRYPGEEVRRDLVRAALEIAGSGGRETPEPGRSPGETPPVSGGGPRGTPPVSGAGPGETPIPTAPILIAEILSDVRALREAVEVTTPGEHAADWVRIFGHSVQGDCPPYEGQYGKPDVFRESHEISDISGFYRAFGLEISKEAKERPDHLAVELEFLHFLSYKEAYARENHGPDEARICRDAVRGFLEGHCLRWVPGFTRRLERIAGSGPYLRLARLTRLVLEEGARRLGIEPGEGELPLRPMEAPEEITCIGSEGPPCELSPS